MPDIGADSDPREITVFVLPAGVGIGLGVFLGLLVESLFVVVVLGVLEVTAGHVVGYLLVSA